MKNFITKDLSSAQHIPPLRGFGTGSLFEIESRLDSSDISASEIQELLADYDSLHRLAFSRPADRNRINSWMEKALLKMAKGDKADRVGFMHWVLGNLRLNHLTVPANIYQWYCSVLRRWRNDIRQNRDEILDGKRTFSGQTPEDTPAVLTFLLEESLTLPV